MQTMKAIVGSGFVQDWRTSPIVERIMLLDWRDRRRLLRQVRQIGRLRKTVPGLVEDAESFVRFQKGNLDDEKGRLAKATILGNTGADPRSSIMLSVRSLFPTRCTRSKPNRRIRSLVPIPSGTFTVSEHDPNIEGYDKRTLVSDFVGMNMGRSESFEAANPIRVGDLSGDPAQWPDGMGYWLYRSCCRLIERQRRSKCESSFDRRMIRQEGRELFGTLIPYLIDRINRIKAEHPADSYTCYVHVLYGSDDARKLSRKVKARMGIPMYRAFYDWLTFVDRADAGKPDNDIRSFSPEYNKDYKREADSGEPYFPTPRRILTLKHLGLAYSMASTSGGKYGDRSGWGDPAKYVADSETRKIREESMRILRKAFGHDAYIAYRWLSDGITLKEVCQRIGVPYTTIRSRILGESRDSIQIG